MVEKTGPENGPKNSPKKRPKIVQQSKGPLVQSIFYPMPQEAENDVSSILLKFTSLGTPDITKPLFVIKLAKCN